MRCALWQKFRAVNRTKICSCLLLAALIMAWISGCTSDDTEISLDNQGNLSCISWGTSLSEAQKQLPEATLQGDTLEMGGTFFHLPVSLTLQFSQVPWTEKPILYEAEIEFSEDTDFDKIADELDQIFGPAETQGVTQNGEKYDLQESDFYWHGDQHLSQLTDEQSLLDSLMETNSVVDTDRISYILRTMYPVKVTMSKENHTLNLDAKYCVELGMMKKT